MKANYKIAFKKISTVLIITAILDGCNSGSKDISINNSKSVVKNTPLKTFSTQNTLPPVEKQYLNSKDYSYIDSLSQQVRSSVKLNGQDGGYYQLFGNTIYNVYPWQVPGIIEILIDTQKNYYNHDVNQMLTNELEFTTDIVFKTKMPDPNKFDKSADINNLITQLLWEEYGCKSASPEKGECQFSNDRHDLNYNGRNIVNSGTFGQMSVINDDRQWWAIAFLNIYKQDPIKYAYLLDAAKQIELIVAKYKQTADGKTKGGICWAPSGKYTIDNSCYVNTITNSLYITLNARLAEAVGVEDSNYQTYINNAKEIADLMMKNKPDNALYNDGIGDFTTNHEQGLWTYNQGVSLDGFALLSNLTGNIKYLQSAKDTVRNTIRIMSDTNGILRELNPSEKNGMFFRGAFFDHLSKFLENIDLSQDPDFTRSVYRFLRHNANSVNTSCSVSLIQSNYDIYHNKDSYANQSCSDIVANTTHAFSNAATQAAVLSLKTTFFRLRSWIAHHPEVDSLDTGPIKSTQFKCNTSNKLRFQTDNNNILGIYLTNTDKFYDRNSMHDVDAPDLCKYAGDGVVRRYTVEVRYKDANSKFFNIASYTWDNKDSKTNIGLDQENGNSVNLSTTEDQEYYINNTKYRLYGGGYNRTPSDGKAGVFIYLQ